MLEIRSSERDGVEVSGTDDELEAVRRGISALASGGGVPVAFEASQVFEPAPDERVLKVRVVALGPSPAKVSVAGAEEVRVEGSPESLEAFTSYFDSGPGAAAGTHSHFEYDEFEGHRWVAPDSLPLVVSVR